MFVYQKAAVIRERKTRNFKKPNVIFSQEIVFVCEHCDVIQRVDTRGSLWKVLATSPIEKINSAETSCTAKITASSLVKITFKTESINNKKIFKYSSK